MPFCRSIRKTWEGRYLGQQLFRSATSVASNYSAAQRARSRKEFASKPGLVLEEADECLFWLVFARLSGIADARQTAALEREAMELVAIFVASVKTLNDQRKTRKGR